MLEEQVVFKENTLEDNVKYDKEDKKKKKL